MSDVRINKWIDLGERTAWTAIQAAAASVIVVLASDMEWQQGVAIVGISALAAACKTIVAQRAGDDELGAIPLPGQHVIEQKPTESATVVASTSV
jgi:hypothetical protein